MRQHAMAVQISRGTDRPAGGSDRSELAGVPFGAPVTFERYSGFHYAGKPGQMGRKAVLLLSPIGFEEMCARTTWRSLAEKIAEAGHACLRFDYPGTADAIDTPDPLDGIEDWFTAARRCIRFLRMCHPATEIVIAGQGFGGSLAARLGPEFADVAGVVLMAPLVKGRSYLRELQAWTRVLTERIGISPDPADENGASVAGFALAAERAKAIRAIDLLQIAQPPAARMLLVERRLASDDSPLNKHLQSLGAEVSAIEYAGYDRILTDPTAAEPPLPTLDSIVAWIDDLPRRTIGGDKPAAALPPAPARPMPGPHYEELPVRFGPGQRLFGVLCTPLGAAPTAVAILANAGRDYHIGWGRASVEQARSLAGRGVASFRFDAGGIGDSASADDAPGEVIYSEQQIDDLRHAIDYIETIQPGPVALVGRCSGAYAAFNAAVHDQRIRDLVIINIERFVWDPRESVEEALRYAHRSIGNFGATLLSRRGLKRLLSGELRVRAAATYVSQRLLRQIGLKLGRLVPQLTAQGRLYSEVHRRFRTLDDRGVRVSLVFSTGDLGLHEFRTYMGEHGERLRRYPGASISMIPDADHNFTHAGARARLAGALCDRLTQGSARPTRS
jgi:alpha-beta hydrolase superfamily lysophospholipase